MTPTAAVLLLISASLHATWNLLSKREDPSVAFMLAANTLGCLWLAPTLILTGGKLPGFSGQVWLYILLTGLFQAVYYIALAGAYRVGDLSVAYPLLRAAPVLMVTALTQFLGQGEPLSNQVFLGASLVACGCLLVPLKRFSDFRWKSYQNLTCLMALIAALGTVGYSMIDSEALQLLRFTASSTTNVMTLTALYSFVEGLSASVWLAVYILARKADRKSLVQLGGAGLRQAALVGVTIYVAYTMVLLAMGYVTNVSYAIAFRQFSIPLGAILGIMVLKEPRYAPKFAGIAVTLIGLILVGIG